MEFSDLITELALKYKKYDLSVKNDERNRCVNYVLNIYDPVSGEHMFQSVMSLDHRTCQAHDANRFLVRWLQQVLAELTLVG